MWNKSRGVAVDAARDLLGSWRSLAITDIAYKVVAFALLTPATLLLLRWMTSRRRHPGGGGRRHRAVLPDHARRAS